MKEVSLLVTSVLQMRSCLRCTVLFITFCPRTRLLEDRMVNPSPGPSSEVEFEVPSLSLSFGLDCG